MAAVSSMACTTFYGVAYWKDGAFSSDSVKAQNTMTQNMSSMHAMMHGSGSMGHGTTPNGADDKPTP